MNPKRANAQSRTKPHPGLPYVFLPLRAVHARPLQPAAVARSRTRTNTTQLNKSKGVLRAVGFNVNWACRWERCWLDKRRRKCHMEMGFAAICMRLRLQEKAPEARRHSALIQPAPAQTDQRAYRATDHSPTRGFSRAPRAALLYWERE